MVAKGSRVLAGDASTLQGDEKAGQPDGRDPSNGGTKGPEAKPKKQNSVAGQTVSGGQAEYQLEGPDEQSNDSAILAFPLSLPLFPVSHLGCQIV